MPKLIESMNSILDEKPREKIEKYGIESLDDAELLAVILRTGYAGMGVRSLSRYLLAEFGTRGVFTFSSFSKLRQQTGLPPVKSCTLLAVAEVMRRMIQKDNVQIKSSEQFYRYIKDDFIKTTFEQLRIICLDHQRRVLYSGLIAQGQSNALTVTLSSVFHHPIRLNCRHFYLAHNHPNGSVKPSNEDVYFTMQIKETAKSFGLLFDDHLIINKEGFYSFSLEGDL